MACLECDIKTDILQTKAYSINSIQIETIGNTIGVNASVSNKILGVSAKSAVLDITSCVYKLNISLSQSDQLNITAVYDGIYGEGHETPTEDLTITVYCDLLSIKQEPVSLNAISVEYGSEIARFSMTVEKFLDVWISEICPFDYVHSCYGAGYWMDDLAWADDDAWRDN